MSSHRDGLPLSTMRPTATDRHSRHSRPFLCNTLLNYWLWPSRLACRRLQPQSSRHPDRPKLPKEMMLRTTSNGTGLIPLPIRSHEARLRADATCPERSSGNMEVPSVPRYFAARQSWDESPRPRELEADRIEAGFLQRLFFRWGSLPLLRHG